MQGDSTKIGYLSFSFWLYKSPPPLLLNDLTSLPKCFLLHEAWIFSSVLWIIPVFIPVCLYSFVLSTFVSLTAQDILHVYNSGHSPGRVCPRPQSPAPHRSNPKWIAGSYGYWPGFLVSLVNRNWSEARQEIQARVYGSRAAAAGSKSKQVALLPHTPWVGAQLVPYIGWG